MLAQTQMVIESCARKVKWSGLKWLHIPLKFSGLGTNYSWPWRSARKGRDCIQSYSLPRSMFTSNEPKLNEGMLSEVCYFWKQTIKEELEILGISKIWKLPPEIPYPAKKALLVAFILKLKRNLEGLPVRFKERLVAKIKLQRKNGSNSQRITLPYFALEWSVCCCFTCLTCLASKTTRCQRGVLIWRPPIRYARIDQTHKY